VTLPYARIGAVLLVCAGCWVAWMLGGLLLAWAALDDLDLIGRIVLIFAFLTLCEAASERFRRRSGAAQHQ
jgi:hypothetical protein